MAREPDVPLDCPTCDEPHLRNHGGIMRRTCSGHAWDDERPDPREVRRACRQFPARGATVCRYHGGAAPQVVAAAAIRERDEAMDRVLRLAVSQVDPAHAAKSPDEQLLEEVGRASMMVQWLADRVAELDVPDLTDTGAFADLVGVDPDTGEPVERRISNQLFGPDHQGNAAPHLYWAMLNQERDRHAKLCKLAIDAGISERLVRLAEAQGQQIVQVIVATIDGIGLTSAQRDHAMRLAAQKLRALGPTGGRVIAG